MVGVSEGKSYGGLLAWANTEWRKFIDQLETIDPDVYNNLWMLRSNLSDPKSISSDHDKWRHLVQQAFFEGYQQGFSSRILKGDVNESDE